ncbi:hypothetical protein OCS_01175 [Ophiocordyceps sinensis CO18]|uniref:Uncharacterized protein n=1 Tax=Ophiocordyceps sinensis (strain Co18 / CGMCC 3.14243) TaxID=911162 RepID=T5AKJ9_OPHSC|nr:hypothetical protein OCS_01175 [Ophiocordyceps sinensis CO18]
MRRDLVRLQDELGVRPWTERHLERVRRRLAPAVRALRLEQERHDRVLAGIDAACDRAQEEEDAEDAEAAADEVLDWAEPVAPRGQDAEFWVSGRSEDEEASGDEEAGGEAEEEEDLS